MGSSDSLNSSNDNLETNSDKSSNSAFSGQLNPLHDFLANYTQSQCSTPNEFEQLCSLDGEIIQTDSTNNCSSPAAAYDKSTLSNSVPHSQLSYEGEVDQSHKTSGCSARAFPQWKNKDNLCWLDVLLCLAVHNNHLKQAVCSAKYDDNNLIHKLFKAHEQALHIVSECSRKSIENTQISPIGPNLCSEVLQLLPASEQEVTHILSGIREEIWIRLQERLRCRKGQHESPVFAFPIFLKLHPGIADLFKMKYRYSTDVNYLSFNNIYYIYIYIKLNEKGYNNP